MSYFISSAAWVVEWVLDSLSWFGVELGEVPSSVAAAIVTLWRFVLTLFEFLFPAGIGEAFVEMVFLVPGIAIVLKAAIWIKGLVWTGGHA